MPNWRTVLAFEVEPEVAPWEFSFKTTNGLFFLLDFEKMKGWSAWGPVLILTPEGRENLDYFDLNVDLDDNSVNCVAPNSGDWFDFGRDNDTVIHAYKNYLVMHAYKNYLGVH